MFLFSLNNSKIGNKYQFIPKSNKLLFMPRLVDFEFNGECEGVQPFNSQIGKFIKRKAKPVDQSVFIKEINITCEAPINTNNNEFFRFGIILIFCLKSNLF